MGDHQRGHAGTDQADGGDCEFGAGDLVDEDALAQALTDGTIAEAALDVSATEALPMTSLLRAALNTVLTRHAAWYSEVADGRLQSLVADEIKRALTGQPARRPIPGTFAYGKD